MISYFLYGIMCLLWGCLAIRIQHKLKYPRYWYNGFVVVFIANILFAPIAIIFAIFRCPIEVYKEPDRREG